MLLHVPRYWPFWFCIGLPFMTACLSSLLIRYILRALACALTSLNCTPPGARESWWLRLSNFEIRNGGQAFRLGRYAIHWHMVGNLRESFQRNVSVHHSWNRSLRSSTLLPLCL